MNIHFFTSDPITNANYLDDRRRNKMIVENLQMMSAALDRHGLDEFKPLAKSGNPYRVTHPRHTSTLWAGDSRSNLLWLCDYTEALYARYRRSGGQSYTNVPDNLARVREGALRMPEKGLTEFVNCARSKALELDFTWMENVHQAYKAYMENRWFMDTIELKWSGIE